MLKLFRTVARVFQQCLMISQAVAFNMFLAFFAILLIVLGLMKSTLEGNSGQELAMRLSTILPPGSWQLVAGNLLRPEVKSWYLALFGWGGTLLLGSRVMKLTIQGIDLIYGDNRSVSALGQQLRSVLLFLVASVVWFGTIALTAFGQLLRQRINGGAEEFPWDHGLWTILLPILTMILEVLVLALIYRVARPGPTSWSSVLPGASVAAILCWGLDVLFGIYVRRTQYGPVYGGLAAAIGLMAWMEFSAMLVFFGAAWNAEAAAASDGHDC